jgi:hypothetical protein
MYSNRIKNPSGEDVLSFDGKPELWEPLVDWRDPKSYPDPIPNANLRRLDARRLAWEFLRRTPRYRWQHQRLVANELIGARVFDGGSRYFDAFHPVPDSLQRHPRKGHTANDAPSSAEETLGEFVARQADRGWFIQHGHDWACDHWGISEMVAPHTPFRDLPEGFFDYSENVVLGYPIDNYAPQELNFSITQNQIVVVFRTDVSAASQWKFIEPELRGVSEQLANTVRPSFEKVKRHGRIPKTLGQKVVLKNLELAPFWLRSWDAFQDSRTKAIQSKARFDSKAVFAAFDREWPDVRSKLLGLSTRRRKKNHEETLDIAFSSDNVRDWIERMRIYLEASDAAYRALLYTRGEGAGS